MFPIHVNARLPIALLQRNCCRSVIRRYLSGDAGIDRHNAGSNREAMIRRDIIEAYFAYGNAMYLMMCHFR